MSNYNASTSLNHPVAEFLQPWNSKHSKTGGALAHGFSFCAFSTSKLQDFHISWVHGLLVETMCLQRISNLVTCTAHLFPPSSDKIMTKKKTPLKCVSCPGSTRCLVPSYHVSSWVEASYWWWSMPWQLQKNKLTMISGASSCSCKRMSWNNLHIN